MSTIRRRSIPEGYQESARYCLVPLDWVATTDHSGSPQGARSVDGTHDAFGPGHISFVVPSIELRTEYRRRGTSESYASARPAPSIGNIKAVRRPRSEERRV